MQKNKVILYNSLCLIALQVCFHSSIIASKPTIQLDTATEAVSAMSIPFSEAVQVINNFGNCYFFARNVYALGKNTNKLLNPSQERQDQIQNIQDQLELIKLRKDFVTCLVENRTSTQQGSLGIPSECEGAALLLASAGAVHEAERMVMAFKNR